MGELSDWLRQIQPRLDSLDRVADYLNEFGYNVSWGEDAGRWLVRTGDQGLFVTDSRDGAEGFLFGLAASLLLLESRGVSLPRSDRRYKSVYSVPLGPDGRWAGSSGGHDE